MIRARRRAHLRIFTVLAPVLPSLVIAGILLRPEVPPISDPERALLAAAGFAESARESARAGETCPSAWCRSLASDDYRFELEIRDPLERRLVIRPVEPILAPDLLLYWVPAPAAGGSIGPRLPNRGPVLVGSLSGDARREVRVPERARAAEGHLVVYSLAQQRIVADLPLPGDLWAIPEDPR